jgi:hypothetical protein
MSRANSLRPSPTPDGDALTRLSLAAIAVIAIGLALQVRDGAFHLGAIALIACALLALSLAIFPRSLPNIVGSRGLEWVLAGLLGIELFFVATSPLALELPPDATGSFVPPVYALWAAILVLFIVRPGLRYDPRHNAIATCLLLAVHLALGVWVVANAPAGGDVYVFQQHGVLRLLSGRNPWAMRFPNIYHPFEGFYGPGLVVKGVLQFGYPYTPLPLLPTSLSWVATHEIRYAHAFALTATAALLAFAKPSRVATLAAMLLVFSPRFGFLLQMAWTEPFVTVLLAGVVFCACRAPRLLPAVLGLFLASKQYLLFVIPAAWWWWHNPKFGKDTLIKLCASMAVAALVIIPFALWNFKAFVHSAVTLQFHQPFRNDALSFVALLRHLGGPELSNVSLSLVLVALWLACRRLTKTTSGFCLAVGFAYFVFLSFNKQAFCNYYFFPMAAICAAIAVYQPDASSLAVARIEESPAA